MSYNPIDYYTINGGDQMTAYPCYVTPYNQETESGNWIYYEFRCSGVPQQYFIQFSSIKNPLYVYVSANGGFAGQNGSIPSSLGNIIPSTGGGGGGGQVLTATIPTTGISSMQADLFPIGYQNPPYTTNVYFYITNSSQEIEVTLAPGGNGNDATDTVISENGDTNYGIGGEGGSGGVGGTITPPDEIPSGFTAAIWGGAGGNGGHGAGGNGGHGAGGNSSIYANGGSGNNGGQNGYSYYNPIGGKVILPVINGNSIPVAIAGGNTPSTSSEPSFAGNTSYLLIITQV